MSLEMKKAIFYGSCVMGFLWLSPASMAQDVTGGGSAEPVCVDEDGDGWGWDGAASCRIPGFVPAAGACVDNDGDGYGWNGVASCIVTEPSACVDEDGDGWGWDGSASCRIADHVPMTGACIDTDGDGWGWNGVASCRPGDTQPEAPGGFDAMLEGVRSYGCVPGDAGFFTTEFVEVFANGLTTYDTWLYEEPDCVSRPLSVNRTLPLNSYTVQEPLTANDGTPVYGLMFEVLQHSIEEGDGNLPIGTRLYDIAAIDQGGVRLGQSFATTPEDRPMDLLDASSAMPVGQRADAASAEGLMHIWHAACFNGQVQWREFNEQHLIETVRYFANNECTDNGFYATRINTWEVSYGAPVTTVFGQPALRVRSELADSRLDDIVIGSGLPSPPALSEIGLVFEDIWGVVDGELVIGTCLDKRSDDACGSAQNVPNMLNFNVGNRYIRQ